MSTTQASTLAGRAPRKLPQGVKVIDVDVHAHETPAALIPYCDMPWRKCLELISKAPERYLDIPFFAPQMAVWSPPYPQSGGDRRQVVTSASQMRKDLDELGIDIGVVFPDNLLMLATLRDPDYATALACAYNRWLTDEWLAGDNGLKGAIVAASQNPLVAAGEIRRYAAHKHVAAIYLPSCCVNPLYGHRCYDPIYEAAQETNLPVMLHSVTAIFPVFPFNLDCFSTMFSAHIVSHGLSMVANLLSLMETGVPERYPKLRIGFSESGIGWVPWIMMRMDKEYKERRRELAFLSDLPSTYVRRMFFATQPIEEPENMQQMATILSLFGGETSVMFASDWPHHDFDHPNKVLQIPVSLETQRNILGGNASRFLNLKENA
jgi:predicted TIM-barrel fold metal-dependent hydrolase